MSDDTTAALTARLARIDPETRDLAPRLNAPALEFLLTRRSTPSKILEGPAPEAETLALMLRIAARTPDHGKLAPWRFLTIAGPAQAALSEAAARRGAARGLDAAACEKSARRFLEGPLIVAVVCAPKPSEKIPRAEQAASAACVCAALVNASLAFGFGANWLTDWPAGDRPFLEEALGLAPEEELAGFIHIGTPRAAPPERPRPDAAALTQALDAAGPEAAFR